MDACRGLLKRDLRRNLVSLFSFWAGKYGLSLNGNQEVDPSSKKSTELQYVSLQAMSALLCCGPYFDSTRLLEDSSLFKWLSGLLNSSDEKVILCKKKVN